MQFQQCNYNTQLQPPPPPTHTFSSHTAAPATPQPNPTPTTHPYPILSDTSSWEARPSRDPTCPRELGFSFVFGVGRGVSTGERGGGGDMGNPSPVCTPRIFCALIVPWVCVVCQYRVPLSNVLYNTHIAHTRHAMGVHKFPCVLDGNRVGALCIGVNIGYLYRMHTPYRHRGVCVWCRAGVHTTRFPVCAQGNFVCTPCAHNASYIGTLN